MEGIHRHGYARLYLQPKFHRHIGAIRSLQVYVNDGFLLVFSFTINNSFDVKSNVLRKEKVRKTLLSKEGTGLKRELFFIMLSCHGSLYFWLKTGFRRIDSRGSDT
ncbi:MAG: hypothetical protein ACUVQY_06045 [Thermoproteota archaeon]